MRIALGIEYQGTDFYGWQAQANLPTIQGSLEAALAKIADCPIQATCAGRTDAGVHALRQVAHFDTTVKRPLDTWISGTNAHLPPSIVVRWARHVDDRFHARFSAKSRTYRYIIYNHPIRPAVFHRNVSWYYCPLDVVLMQEAGQHLIGEHDFSSFRSSECNSKTPMRCVMGLSVTRQGHFVIVDIEANAFLHHMVRNIVGTLIKIGGGLMPPRWMESVLLAKNRQMAGVTAPPDGLYFVQARYPSPYIFPAISCQFLPTNKIYPQPYTSRL